MTMHVHENIQDNLLTAIIPITDLKHRSRFLKIWLESMSPLLPIKLIFVLDSDNQHEIKEFKSFTSVLLGLDYEAVIGNFGSPGSSRNAGYAIVDTDWVCFWDSDDLPIPEEVINAIRENGTTADLIIGGFVKVDANQSMKDISHSCDSTLYDIFSRDLGIWRVIFSTGAIKQTEFSQKSMGEDQLFMCQLGVENFNVVFSPRTFYQYVIHSNHRLTESSLALRDLLDVQVALIRLIETQKEDGRLISTIVLLRATLSGIKRLAVRDKLLIAVRFLVFCLNLGNLKICAKSLKILLEHRIER